MFGVHFRFRFISFATADLFPTKQDIVVICFSLSSLLHLPLQQLNVMLHTGAYLLFMLPSLRYGAITNPQGDIQSTFIEVAYEFVTEIDLCCVSKSPPSPHHPSCTKKQNNGSMLHFGNSIWSRDVNVDIQNFALYFFLFSLSVCRSIGPWALASSSLDDVFFNFIIIWPLVAFPFPKKRKWSVMFVGCLRVTIWHISNSCDGVRFVRGRVRREVERINVIIWCEK